MYELSYQVEYLMIHIFAKASQFSFDFQTSFCGLKQFSDRNNYVWAFDADQ